MYYDIGFEPRLTPPENPYYSGIYPSPIAAWPEYEPVPEEDEDEEEEITD